MAIIAVTSGTSGAGKTTVAINLAAALAHLDRRVVLFDATPPPSTVAHRLGVSGHPDPSDGPHGVRIVAHQTEGWGRRPSKFQEAELFTFIQALDAEADYVVVDTATSPRRVSPLVSLADEIALVTAPERRAPARALALIRGLSAVSSRASLGLVVNGVTDPPDGERVYRVISEAARFLDQRVASFGVVAADPELARAQMMQRAVVDCRPQAPASRCFETLARCIAHRGPFGGGGLSKYPQSWRGTALTRIPRPTEARECA